MCVFFFFFFLFFSFFFFFFFYLSNHNFFIANQNTASQLCFVTFLRKKISESIQFTISNINCIMTWQRCIRRSLNKKKKKEKKREGREGRERERERKGGLYIYVYIYILSFFLSSLLPVTIPN